MRESLQGLSPELVDRIQYKWIHQRILSMEDIWLKAGRSLSAQHHLTGRKAKQVWHDFFLSVFFILTNFIQIFILHEWQCTLTLYQSKKKNHYTQEGVY